MTAVRHLVVGPAGHGVVRHALWVAAACGQPAVHRARADDVVDADLAGVDVVHLAFTDKLFGATCEAAAAAFTALAARVASTGAAVSVTLHDLPMGPSDRSRRRRAAYRRVVGPARGVVVSSRHEMALLEEVGGLDVVWSRRVIPLPVLPVAPPPRSGAASPVPAHAVVLGFLHPDRGHEEVLAELPPGASLTALGAPAAGHEDLPGEIAALAARLDRPFRMTGHVPDEALAEALWAAPVPVAPHRHVSASGSIATWLAHGRRPLVPDIRYTRELERCWPGTVRRYDPDRPGALRAAIETSVDDPALTWLAPGVRPGPDPAALVEAYRRHLDACAPPAVVRVGARHLVPGNRWDLLDGVHPPDPAVTVVVPYYDAQDELDLVLTALTRQTHPAARLQVIVADDGSPRPPDLGAAAGLDVRTVRQDDRGFRAGAARTLGAAAADGDVVAFLDGDTVPDPGYVRAVARLPALSPDALVVGRRRHARAEDIRDWLAGGPDPAPLPEPTWLSGGYARSRDLLDADERSYRFVISAVLAMPRSLFAELGGFDPVFTSYGGEDWELASRAWNAGALFAHVPSAVAWHVGPDWAGRGGRPGDKATEDRLIARLVPDPEARGSGGVLDHPRAVVRAPGDRPDVVSAAAAALRSADLDAGVWVADPGGAALAARWDDPLVRGGSPPVAVLARARTVVDLHAPVTAGELAALAAPGEVGVRRGPSGTARSTRATARSRRWAAALGVDADVLAERLFPSRDLVADDPGDPAE